MLVSQFHTISSHWFANITADFILPSHFYDHLHCPSAPTEFVLNPLTVKPLQHAIKINRDQQRPWITHCMDCIHGGLVWSSSQYSGTPLIQSPMGQNNLAVLRLLTGWPYYRGRLKFCDLRAIMTNTPHIAFTLLEQQLFKFTVLLNKQLV